MVSTPTETYWTLQKCGHGQAHIPTSEAIIQKRGANRSDRRRFKSGTNQLLFGSGKLVYQYFSLSIAISRVCQYDICIFKYTI